MDNIYIRPTLLVGKELKPIFNLTMTDLSTNKTTLIAEKAFIETGKTIVIKNPNIQRGGNLISSLFFDIIFI